MDPWEYACKWVPLIYGINPDERGFKDAAAREISRITGRHTGSIRNWGSQFENAPQDVRLILKMADLLNAVAKDWHFPNS